MNFNHLEVSNLFEYQSSDAIEKKNGEGNGQTKEFINRIFVIPSIQVLSIDFKLAYDNIKN